MFIKDEKHTNYLYLKTIKINFIQTIFVILFTIALLACTTEPTRSNVDDEPTEFNDIKAVSISGSNSFFWGNSGDFTIEIKNIGETAAVNFYVELRKNGLHPPLVSRYVSFNVGGGILHRDSTRYVTLNWSPSTTDFTWLGEHELFGEVNWSRDNNIENNRTKPINVAVAQPNIDIEVFFHNLPNPFYVNQEITLGINVRNNGREVTSTGEMQLLRGFNVIRTVPAILLSPGQTRSIDFSPISFSTTFQGNMTGRVIIDDDVPGNNSQTRWIEVRRGGYDLSMLSFSGPDTENVGHIMQFTALIRNVGVLVANNYTLELRRAGFDTPLVTVEGVRLNPNTSSGPIFLTWVPSNQHIGTYNVYAKIVWDLDDNLINNTSSSKLITITDY